MKAPHTLRLFAAACCTLIPIPVVAQAAFDSAANYQDTWYQGNQGTGFEPFFVGRLNGVAVDGYTIPIASAATVGGNAGVMDDSGKAFITTLQPNAGLNAMVTIARPLVATADGIQAGLKAHAVGGKMQISFRRTSGRFGRVMTDGGNWKVRIGATDVHITPYASNVPVEVIGTFFGTLNKWNVTIKNLETNDSTTYTDITADVGSGNMSALDIFALAQPSSVASYVFNSLTVASPSRVEDALSY